MNRRRRIAAALVALLAVVSLAACYKGDVVKKDPDRAGHHAILVNTGSRERWIEVNEAQYKACSIGEQWPKCGEGLREPNPEAQEPAPNADPKPEPPKDDRIVATVNLSSTARGFLLSYSCPGKEIHENVNTRSFHQRCLMRSGQRVTVVGAARGASFDCSITILGGEVVDSNVGGNTVRCAWVHNR